MTVRDLITRLEAMPPDAQVVIPSTGDLIECYYPLDEPYTIEVQQMIGHPDETMRTAFVEKQMVDATKDKNVPMFECADPITVVAIW